ncbi:MAG: ABC transporter permease subunit [Brevinema sp.]
MINKNQHRTPVLFALSTIILAIAIIGIFAPFFAPHDPYTVDILNTLAPISFEYPLGTDQLGRCILSRLIYGIRYTLGLSFIIMLAAISIGIILGSLSGYIGGILDKIILSCIDIMLSFPPQIIIFAVVALFGIGIRNIILANIFIKWAWYARIIRANIIKHKNKNFVHFSRVIGNSPYFIFKNHLLSSISSETAVLASLDIGWTIINISTLSFLGLGVQPPTPEWGAMLNDAKEVMVHTPLQMLIPGIAIVALVTIFNFLADILRDVLDPKESG